MTRARVHRRRYEVPGHVRYLTFSCQRRLPLFNNDSIKNHFAAHLEACHQQLRFRLIAWVLMPNHVHLMLIPPLPAFSVSAVLEHLKAPFAKEVLCRWRELRAPILDKLCDSQGRHRFWLRGGGYDRNIVSDDEFYEKVEYIHNNPVRAGLVDDPLDWAWSSARWYADQPDGPVTIDSFAP